MSLQRPLILLFGLSGTSALLSLAFAVPPTERVPTRQSLSSSAEPTAENQDSFQKPAQEIDHRRRKELLSFVRENHPELEPLVLSLKEKLPRQYENAIRSIDKSVTQLQAIKNGGNQLRYDQALEYWKLNSRIQLLSAQLSIEDTPARRKQLKRLITKQFDERKNQLIADRQRTTERLARLNETIEKSETGREAEIDQRLESIVRIAERTRAQRDATVINPADPDKKIDPTPAKEQ